VILARLADALPDPPPAAPTTLRVTFDGGSRGNPGQGYGSFAVESPKWPQPHIERRTYPGMLTNNQAEYLTLIAALEYILAALERTQRDPGQFVLEIAGDSALVIAFGGAEHINQVTGTWKVKQPELRPLADRCRDLLARFGNYD
jgi:ribonuclease HI